MADPETLQYLIILQHQIRIPLKCPAGASWAEKVIIQAETVKKLDQVKTFILYPHIRKQGE